MYVLGYDPSLYYDTVTENTRTKMHNKIGKLVEYIPVVVW